jgi:hypothetical protein
VTDGLARGYAIDPEPDEAGRAAIVAALEQLLREPDHAPTPWAVQARREIVDDGIA